MLKVNRQIGRMPVSFTPAFYKHALRQFRQGSFGELTGLMDAAVIDSQVNGCLIARNAGFMRNWRITEASEKTEDIKAAEFVRETFSGLNIHELMEDIFDARLRKYSVIGLEWDVRNGRQAVTAAKKFHQKYFRFNDDGVLCVDFLRELRTIPEDSALVCVSNRDPALLPVLRDYILKEFGLNSWASFIETFGEPFIIGKYPPGAEKSFVLELESAVNSLASSSRGVAPEDSRFEIIESKRNTGDHMKFVENCNRGIAISLLGHANAVENSSGLQVGENMSAWQVKREIALSDISFIEGHMRRLIKMLVERNFAGAKAPVFTVDRSEPIDIRERLEVLRQAYSQGYRIHPDEYARLGLYKYDDQKPLQKPVKEGTC